MQKEKLTLSEEVAVVLAEHRDCSIQEITDDEVTMTISKNRKILDLYGELGECAALAFRDLEVASEDSEDASLKLEIEASDSNQEGGRIRYSGDEYELLQFSYKYYDDKSLRIKVAALPTLEEAKKAGVFLFDHAAASEKTLRVPLSVDSYIESVDPFSDFVQIEGEGKVVKLSDIKQEDTKEEIQDIIDSIKKIKEEEIDSIKKIKEEEIDKEIPEFFEKFSEEYKNPPDLKEDREKEPPTRITEKKVKDFFNHKLKFKPNAQDMEYIYFHFLSELNSLSEKKDKKKFEMEIDTSTDFCKIYQKEIAKFPKLTKEEEIELAKKFEAGDKKAKEQLINSNLRCVYKIAVKQYIRPSDSMDRMDLVQAGSIGLIKAVENFDYRRGNKVETYATPWILNEIKDAIHEMRAQKQGISGGRRNIEEIGKVAAAREKLIQELGREPSLEEIAEATKPPKGKKLSEERVAECLRIIKNEPESLDKLIGEDDNISLGDLIRGESIDEYSPELPDDVKLGNILTSDEMDVLLMRDKRKGKKGASYTDKEIAEELGLSLEEVRQIGQNANRRVYENLDVIQRQMIDFDQGSVKLSERMAVAASMITLGNVVADLGEDHALIPIALCSEWGETGERKGICTAIAMAFDEREFKLIKANAEKYGKSDEIEIRRTNLIDGLEKLDAYDASTVLISESSPKVIKAILTRHALPVGVSELVLQSQQADDIAEVRRCIREIGFLIKEEDMILENGKFYPTIKALREDTSDTIALVEEIIGSTEELEVDAEEDFYQEMEDAFGPKLLAQRNTNLKIWLEQEIGDIEGIMNLLEEKIKDGSEENGNLKLRQEELENKMELMKAALNHLNQKTIDNS